MVGKWFITIVSPPPPGEENKSYLVFYNKLTGILRVFYYNNNDVIPADATFWRLEITQPTSLFNSSGPISLLMGERLNNPAIYVSNLTTVPSKSVARGWNCFDVELAYDNQLASKNAMFNIALYSIMVDNVELKGVIDFESTGTIVTHVPSQSQTPGWINNASKVAGDGVKELVGGLFSSSLISGGVSSLVASGAKYLLGSFVAKNDNMSTFNSNVQLTTMGEVELEGTFESLSTPNVLPLANNPLPGCVKSSNDSFLPSYDEPLGVWAVDQLPVLYKVDDPLWCFSYLTSRYESDKRYQLHQEQMYYFEPDSLKLSINPTVLEIIDNCSVEIRCVYVKKDKHPETYNPFGIKRTMGQDLCWGIKGSNERLWNDSTVWIFDGNLSLKGGSGTRREFVACDNSVEGYLQNIFDTPSEFQQFCMFGSMDNITYYLNQPSCYYPNDVEPRIERDKFYYKVTLTLYPKAPYDTDPIVLMRTFKPQIVTIYENGDWYPTGWIPRFAN